jgi:hypothetical protein
MGAIPGLRGTRKAIPYLTIDSKEMAPLGFRSTSGGSRGDQTWPGTAPAADAHHFQSGLRILQGGHPDFQVQVPADPFEPGLPVLTGQARWHDDLRRHGEQGRAADGGGVVSESVDSMLMRCPER